MLQKGKIEQVIDKYNYKVRIPKYDKVKSDASGTSTEELATGVVCITPGADVSYTEGDIVIVSFENDELSKPVILGLLYRDNNENLDSGTSLVDLNKNLEKLGIDLSELKSSSDVYTHIKYSNDNGLTFTSLYNNNMGETTDTYGATCCVPYFPEGVPGVEIDNESKVISWFVTDSNNLNVTDDVDIETRLFDSDGNILRIISPQENLHTIILNNTSQISGKLYLTYKIYVAKEYLDTLHISLSTDKNALGSIEGDYIGVYSSKDEIPSLEPSDYRWFSFNSAITNSLDSLQTKIELDLNARLLALKSDIYDNIDENTKIIFYKSVDWTQAEVATYSVPGYKAVWTRDSVKGYTGEVKEGNILYITVHNTGDPSIDIDGVNNISDDSYGRLMIKATSDAASGVDVPGEVITYDASAEIALDALVRFRSSLLEDGDETIIYGGHIQTGTITAREITTNTISGEYGEINFHEGTFSYGNPSTGQGISWDGTNLSIGSDDITDQIDEISGFIDQISDDLEEVKNQVDGNITSWFYDYVPTTSNLPASDWITNHTESEHTGDLFYNTVSGTAYRWVREQNLNPPPAYTYSWMELSDSGLAEALARAAAAQDTADSKRRVFYVTPPTLPTPPYDVGDLWVQGSQGDIKRCAVARAEGETTLSGDWVLASKYTDDSALETWINGDFVTALEDLQTGLEDSQINTFYQSSDPSSSWTSAEKENHEGDLWFCTDTSGTYAQKYWRYNGSIWEEMKANPPQSVFDRIDGKATIFVGETIPSNPQVGDLWFKGQDYPILTYVEDESSPTGYSWKNYNNSVAEDDVYTKSDFTMTPSQIEASVTSVTTWKDNFKLGGRNLLLNTGQDTIVNLIDASTNYYAGYFIESDYGKKITNGNTTDEFTLSFDWETTSSTGEAYVQIQGNETSTITSNISYVSGNDPTLSPPCKINLSNGSGHYIIVFKFTSTQAVGDKQNIRIKINGSESAQTANSTFTVRNMKLEYGNNPSDWTAAPEDIESRVTTAETTITQTSEVIALKADKQEVESAFNMLIDSDAPTTATKVYASYARYFSSTGNTSVTCSDFTLEDAPEKGIKYGRRFENNGVNTGAVSRGYAFYNTTENAIPFTAGQTYTASWWARCTSGSGKTVLAYSNGGSTTTKSSDRFELTSNWQKYVHTFTVEALSSSYNRIWFQAYFAAGTAGTVEICGCKLIAGDSPESVKSYASAQFDVQAGQISSKVSSTDFNGNTIKSIINQSPDSVTIDANQVNITGAAIFNSGRLSTTSLNNTYDAKGSASSALASAKTYSDGTLVTAKEYADDAVSDIGVGGRNYLRNTEFFTKWTNCGGGTAGTFDNANGTYKFPATSADGWTEIRPNLNVPYSYVRNKSITISAEVMGTSGQTISVMVNPYVSTTSTGDRAKYRNVYLALDGGGTSAKTVAATGGWQKVYATVYINDAFFSSGSTTVNFASCYFGARCSRANTNHNSYYIQHIQIEEGTISTSWRPAIEDISIAIADAQNSANTANASVITYSGTCGTGWETANKVVACSNFYTTSASIPNGTLLTVVTSASNNVAGLINLNVNNTGNIPVYVNGVATSASNQLLWVYGAVLNFVYTTINNINCWLLSDLPASYRGSRCTTAAATQAKVTDVYGVVVQNGTNLVVPMAYVNTYGSSSSYPTMSLGYGNTRLGSTNYPLRNIVFGSSTSGIAPLQSTGFSWVAGSEVSFIFDGQRWRFGDQTFIDGGNVLTGKIAAERLNIADITVSNFSAAVQQQFDNSKVVLDGQNILRRTEYLPEAVFGSGAAYEMYSSGSAKATFCIKMTGASDNYGSMVSFGPTLFTDFLDGSTEYTLSFEYLSSASIEILTYISGASSQPGGLPSPRTKYTSWQGSVTLPSSGSKWKRFSFNPRTIAVSQLTTSSGDVNSFFIQLYNRTANGILRIRYPKLERGNKPTGWTPAPGDGWSGGRNLLRGTDQMLSGTGGWSSGEFYKTGTGTVDFNYSINNSPIYNLRKGVRLTTTAANTNIGFAQALIPIRKEEITFSIWAKGTAGDKISLQPIWKNGNSAYHEEGSKLFIIPDSNWHRYSITKVPNFNQLNTAATSETVDGTTTSYSCNFGYVYFNSETVGRILYVIAPMLEYGNTPSDWGSTCEADMCVTRLNDSGMKIHSATDLTDYLQINSGALSIYRDNKLKTNIADGAINLYGGAGTYPRIYISASTEIDSSVTEPFVRIYKDASNYINLNSSGLQVYQGGVNVSSFGSTVRIGQSGKARTEMSASAVNFYDLNNKLRGTINSDGFILKDGSTTVGQFGSTMVKLAVPPIIQGYQMLDFVIDYHYDDTSGVWSYRKFANGTLECWANITTTKHLSDSRAGGYMFNSDLHLPNYPIPFVKKPSVTLGGYCRDGTTMIPLVNDSNDNLNNCGSINAFRGNKNTSDTTKVLTVFAIGSWKDSVLDPNNYRWGQTS